MAVSSSTSSSIHVFAEARIAATPIPITIRRNPCTPPARARDQITAAVARPPITAPAVISGPLDENSTTASSMPVNAPLDSPKTSGLARGFRVTVWKSAPEIARNPPSTIAASARGIRQSSTTVRSRASPPPSSTWSTAEGVSGYVPRPSATTARRARTRTNPAATARLRARRVTE